MGVQALRDQPGAGNELEAVPQGPADGQPFLVRVGHGAALLPRLAAAQSGRQPGTDSRSGVQHLHLVHGEL